MILKFHLCHEVNKTPHYISKYRRTELSSLLRYHALDPHRRKRTPTPMFTRLKDFVRRPEKSRRMRFKHLAEERKRKT